MIHSQPIPSLTGNLGQTFAVNIEATLTEAAARRNREDGIAEATVRELEQDDLDSIMSFKPEQVSKNSSVKTRPLFPRMPRLFKFSQKEVILSTNAAYMIADQAVAAPDNGTENDEQVTSPVPSSPEAKQERFSLLGHLNWFKRRLSREKATTLNVILGPEDGKVPCFERSERQVKDVSAPKQ